MRREALAKYVLFVVDGAPSWPRLVRRLPQPEWIGSAAVDVPESASAASAMSTGCATPRRAVSTAGEPLGAAARRSGLAIGFATDTCAVDVTGASFFASAPSRYNAARIGAGVAASGLSVILGGFSGAMPAPPADACVVRTTDDLDAPCAPGRLLFGAFGLADGALAAECAPQGPTDPPLYGIARAAIRRLPNASFLVIAADRMDGAAHVGDAASVARLERDIARAVRVLAEDPALRLLIVTGDHGTRFGTREHFGDAVPVLAYGPEAGALENVFPSAMMAQTDVRRAFPFGREAPKCAKRREQPAPAALGWVGAVVAATAAVATFWLVSTNRK